MRKTPVGVIKRTHCAAAARRHHCRDGDPIVTIAAGHFPFHCRIGILQYDEKRNEIDEVPPVSLHDLPL
jgi:hypothetical protein